MSYCGAVPYKSSSTSALYGMIRSPEPVVLPEQPVVSPQLRDLLTRLLDKNPATRISLDEVCMIYTRLVGRWPFTESLFCA